MSNKQLPSLDYLPAATPQPDLSRPSKSSTQGSYVNDEKIDFYADVKKKQDHMEKMKRAIKSNPFVPIGCLITLGVLTKGLFAMKNKDVAKSQAMMRYRVAAQGCTLVALIAGTFITQLIYTPSDD